MMRRALLVLVVGGGFALPFACVDTTPIHVEEEHKDASVNRGADSALAAECRECVMGDGAPCRSDYDLCVSLPGCGEFTDCVFRIGCFSYPLLEDRLACGQPCIDAIGLTSTHPALPGILALNTCTQGPCASACIRQ